MEPSLKSCWSECMRPFLLIKLLKYSLSKDSELVTSRGARLLSPPVLGQFDCNEVVNEESMLVSL